MPSGEIFRDRLDALVTARGIQAIADRYSSAATPSSRRATVVRWLRGGTPRARTARNIAVAGRRQTGPAVRLQDPETGQVRYLTTRAGISARESLIQRERLRRTRMSREARTPSEIASALAIQDVPIEQPIDEFVFNWEDELDDLRTRTEMGELYEEDSDLWIDWEEWRSRYNDM